MSQKSSLTTSPVDAVPSEAPVPIRPPPRASRGEMT
jgi:hypothetical protein